MVERMVHAMPRDDERPAWAARLEHERVARMWSKPKMARALWKTVGVPQPTKTQVESLARQIRWYEKGRYFPRDWVDAYAKVSGTSPAELFEASPIDQPPGGDLTSRWSEQAASENTAEYLLRLCRSDLVSELDGAAAADGDQFLDTIERLLVFSGSASLPIAPTATVSMEHVRQVEAATEIFRGWDNQFGGGLRRKAVVGQLSEVIRLLDGPFADPVVGQRLYAAMADLTQLAGFMSFDVQLHGVAQQYFTLGLQLAKAIGDRLQAARMLYCLARQMIELGEPRSALDLAQCGLYVIRRTGNARVAAMLYAMKGRACGGMGDARACRSALEQAAEDFDCANADDDPPWAGFFTRVELMGIRGVALRDLSLCHLGQGDQLRAATYAAEARPYIAQAAEGRSRDYLRSQVLDLDGLAVVSFLMGDPEQAASALHRALNIAAPVSSARTKRNLERTVRLGRSHYGELPEVRDLRDRARIALSHELEGP